MDYSLHREREARHFISRHNADLDPPLYIKSDPTPLMCVALVTVRRDMDDYFEASVGSLLEGLDKQERSKLYLSLLFANTEPRLHPSWGQRWIERLADSATTYNVSDSQLEHLQSLERERNFYEKGVFDYLYALRTCQQLNASYTIIFEDDIILAAGWFSRTLQALANISQLEQELGKPWIYLRLFYTETALSWTSADFAYRNMPFVFGLLMLSTLLCLVALRRTRFKQFHLDTASIAIISMICVPAFTALVYMVGKYSLMPLHGVIEMNQGHGQTDSMIEEYADQDALTRYALAPPQLQHTHHRHRALKLLVESLVDTAFNPLSEKTEITDTDLAPYHIRRVDFDIEAASGPESTILFEPLPQWKLDRHSVRATADEESKETATILLIPKLDRDYLTNHIPVCAESIGTSVAGSHTSPGLAILGTTPEARWSTSACNLTVPNPYILHSVGWTGRLGFDKGWVAREEHEFKRDENGSRHPHLILFTEQRRNGREGTLLYGEVAPLIASMYARSVQRDIPEDRLHPEVQDGIMEDDGLDKFVNNPSLLENYDLAFDEESEFPVLMVSFLGPQHARLFYAHMEGITLVIRQSKLYSFERRETAPWDLFARWVLSMPVK
ncbi:hypothetical protein HFD88_001969 [Aspergillus terreus]|nr:hypothetical protein HFD88_001969 [Aspergillus terreus]